jgi:hypothetical protein
MKMKLFVAFSALAGIAVGASIAYATEGSAGGGIVNSKHDMRMFIQTYGGTADYADRVCAFCHTPHHAEDPATAIGYDAVNTTEYTAYTPLWSHALPENLDYDQYVSVTFNPGLVVKDGVANTYDPMIGPSRLCMSCHDGTVAVDSYYGKTGTATNKGEDFLESESAGNFAVAKGHGLSNDHPVGMRYSDYVADGSHELKETTSTLPNNTDKSVADLLFNDANQGLSDIMTCASCHDVHNGKAVLEKPASGRGYFLVEKQAGSALCLTCHDKNS